MKKIYTFMAMAFMVMLSLTFTSCEYDDDSAIAYTLEGTWSGNMQMSWIYDGRTYDASYTELCFARDPYRFSSGTGYWIDYYQGRTPWGRNYVASHIEWRVINTYIEIYFVEEDEYVRIQDYRLSDNYFSGTIVYGDSYIDFRLRHVSSPNWSSYEYGWYDDYYYAKQGRMMAPAKPGAEKPEAPKRVIGHSDK